LGCLQPRRVMGEAVRGKRMKVRSRASTKVSTETGHLRPVRNPPVRTPGCSSLLVLFGLRLWLLWCWRRLRCWRLSFRWRLRRLRGWLNRRRRLTRWRCLRGRATAPTPHFTSLGTFFWCRWHSTESPDGFADSAAGFTRLRSPARINHAVLVRRKLHEPRRN